MPTATQARRSWGGERAFPELRCWGWGGGVTASEAIAGLMHVAWTAMTSVYPTNTRGSSHITRPTGLIPGKTRKGGMSKLSLGPPLAKNGHEKARRGRE